MMSWECSPKALKNRPCFSSGWFSHVLVLRRDELKPTLKAHADLRDVLKPCGL